MSEQESQTNPAGTGTGTETLHRPMEPVAARERHSRASRANAPAPPGTDALKFDSTFNKETETEGENNEEHPERIRMNALNASIVHNKAWQAGLEADKESVALVHIQPHAKPVPALPQTISPTSSFLPVGAKKLEIEGTGPSQPEEARGGDDLAGLVSDDTEARVTRWSDDEPATGLPEARPGFQVLRPLRSLFCCGVPLEAPSEDEIPDYREGYPI